MTTAYREISPVRLTLPQEYGAFRVLDEKRFGLFDGGGYGKTNQAIEVMRLIEISTGQRPKTVVIGPNSAREYWWSQIGVNYPEQRTTLLNDYSAASVEKTLADSDVVIMNHEAFDNKKTRDRVTSELKAFGPRYVIVDEAHDAGHQKTGSHMTYRYNNIRQLTDYVEYLALLTATPIPHGMSDIFHRISMLEPDTYPTPYHVMKAYHNNPLVLGSVLSRKMLRRGDVEIPEINRHLIELDTDTLAVYTEVLECDYISPTEKLDQLRKASLDPAIVDPDIIKDPALRERLGDIKSPKYRDLEILVKAAKERGEKSVVFSSRFVDGVTRKLEQLFHEYGALRIDGSVPASYRGNESEREKVRQAFQTNPQNWVLITGDVMSQSLPLTAASQEYFLDFPYEWGRLYQMVKRIDRRGQDKPVSITALIANYPFHPKGSIDIGIEELLNDEKRIIDYAMRGGKVKLEEGKIVSDAPVHTKRPVEERLYSQRQQLRRILSTMAGQNAQANDAFLHKNEGTMGRELASVYIDGWDYSYSAKTSQVYKEIIEGLMKGGARLEKRLDAPSGPAVGSKALGIPFVNLDANEAHFEKAKEWGVHTDNQFVRGLLHELEFDDESFDLYLCSLGLNHTELERPSKEGTVIREREKAIREANRVLRRGGYYLVALPDYLNLDEERFYKGLGLAGFNVIPDLSGKVIATEPADSRFGVYIITSIKAREPANEIGRDYFGFKIDEQIMESRRKRAKPSVMPPQPRLEVCTKFAFQNSKRGDSDIGSRITNYASSLISDEVRSQVSTLPVETRDSMEYVLVKKPRGLTIYVPKLNVESLLEQLRANHHGANRNQLRADNPELYNELRRLKLLGMVPK